MAQKVFEAVRAYLDNTARKHDCVGFACKLCSLHGDRGEELYEEIKQALEETR